MAFEIYDDDSDTSAQIETEERTPTVNFRTEEVPYKPPPFSQPPNLHALGADSLLVNSNYQPPKTNAPPEPQFHNTDSGSDGNDDAGDDDDDDDTPTFGQRPAVPAFRTTSSFQPMPMPQTFPTVPSPEDQEALLQKKRELLYKFHRLESKGIPLPRKFTLASSLEDMEADYERIRKERETDASIQFQRKLLTTVVSGIEFLNTRFDPFNIQLDGWSENVHGEIDTYDEVFEELGEKYSGSMKMAPELRLIMMVAGSAFMCHMSNSMFRGAPKAKEVLNSDPELKRHFAASTAKMMQNQGDQTGLAGMFSGMFQPSPPAPSNTPGNTAMGGGRPAPAEPTSRMNGPGNIEEIMRELNRDTEDHIEVLSTIADSDDISDGTETASLSRIVSKGGKRTLHI